MLGWIFTEYLKKEKKNPIRTNHKFTHYILESLTDLSLCSCLIINCGEIWRQGETMRERERERERERGRELGREAEIGSTLWHLAVLSALVKAWHLPNPHYRPPTATPISAGQGWLADKPVTQSEIWDLSKPRPDVGTRIHTDSFPCPTGMLAYLLRQILRQLPWPSCIWCALMCLFKRNSYAVKEAWAFIHSAPCQLKLHISL